MKLPVSFLAASLLAMLGAAQESTATATDAAPNVAVLEYKSVGTAPGAVNPEDFVREMLYLKETGTPVVSPADYLEWRRGLRELPPRSVLLTFKEVQGDFRMHALPVLQQCGFPYMVMAPGAALPGEERKQVTDDASFAHAVNFDAPGQDAAVLEDVKACTPAVETVPHDVVLPAFTDDDVAEEVEEEELPAEVLPPVPPAVPTPEPLAPAENVSPAETTPAEPAPVPVPEAEPALPPAAPVETPEPPPTELPPVPSPATEPSVPAGDVPTAPAVVAELLPVTPTCGVLGKRSADGDWVTAEFKQPLVPREQTQVAVLGYHNFSKTKPRTEMRMSTADFCRQMQFLKDSDICVISMQDFLEWRFGTRQLPARCVLITIDDGWKSVYTDAYPILKAYGYPFTLYLYTRYIDVQGDSMTTAQIQEMLEQGATIGSHSSNHLYPSKWKRYKQDSPEYAAQLVKELHDSRIKLTEMFGNCSTYCYPGGYNTAPMHASLEEAGYQAAFTVLENKVECEESAFSVHRYMVFGTNHEIFRRAVNFDGVAGVAPTRAAIAAAEAPAQAFFPAAFEGCTNRTSAEPTKKTKATSKKKKHG